MYVINITKEKHQQSFSYKTVYIIHAHLGEIITDCSRIVVNHVMEEADGCVSLAPVIRCHLTCI